MEFTALGELVVVQLMFGVNSILVGVMVLKLLSYIGVFSLGAIIEATDYKALISDVSWTDIIGSISTLVTAIIVYKTYSMWLKSRKREDSYQTSKNYIECLILIDDHINDLMKPFNLAVPQAGNRPIDVDQSIKLLGMSNEALYKLNSESRRLCLIHAELGFWGVALTKQFEISHQNVLKELQAISVISSVLQTKIYNYYQSESRDMSGMITEFNSLNERVSLIISLLDSRYNHKYADFFVYKK